MYPLAAGGRVLAHGGKTRLDEAWAQRGRAARQVRERREGPATSGSKIHMLTLNPFRRLP